METIQSQLGPAIDSEREINNAVNFKLHRRSTPPEWVVKGKLTHIERLVKDGVPITRAASLAHVATNTALRWRKQYGILSQNLKQQKGETMKVAKKVRGRRRMFTFEQRMELAHQANEMLASKKAINLGHAASLLGVGPGSLSTWRKLAARKQRFYKHKVHRTHRDMTKTNGLTVSLNEAIGVLRDVTLGQGAPKGSVETLCLMYENALLKKRISR